MRIAIQHLTEPVLVSHMRELGYATQRSRTGEMNFLRRLGSDTYPRFHVYAQNSNAGGQEYLTIHIDQKKPSYEGHRAHSGEYEGELVEQEAQRIKDALQ